MVCLRSTNAESTERLFSQTEHISQRATNRKPDNVLTTILLSLQAKEETGTSTTISSIHQQGTTVTEVTRKACLQWDTYFKVLFKGTNVQLAGSSEPH